MPRRNKTRIHRAAGLVLAAALALGGTVTMTAAPASATPAPTSTSQAPIPDWGGFTQNDGSPQLRIQGVCWWNGDFPGSWDLPAGAYLAGLEVNFTNASTGFSKSYPVADQYFEIPRAPGQIYEATYRLNGQIIGQKSEILSADCSTWMGGRERVTNGERVMEFKAAVPHNDGSPRVHPKAWCGSDGTVEGSWDLPVGAYPAGLQVNFTLTSTGASKSYPVEDRYFKLPRVDGQFYKVTYLINDKTYGDLLVGQRSEVGMIKAGENCKTWASQGQRAMEFTEVRPVDWNAVRHVGREMISPALGYVNFHLLNEAANSKFRYILELDDTYVGEYYQGQAYGMTLRENHTAGTIELRSSQPKILTVNNLKVYLATGEPGTTAAMKAPLAVPVEEIKREDQNAAFTFDKNYFNSNARYILTIDGKYSGEIHNGQTYYTNGHRENDNGTITVLDHLIPDGKNHTIAIHIATGAPGDSTEGMHTLTTTEMLADPPAPAAVQSTTQFKQPTLKAGEAGQIGLRISTLNH